MLIYQIC